MPAAHTTGWEPDLDAYLAHERIKSVIVDTIRYCQATMPASHGKA
jgi:hypothetical protein